jgi:hypothetical protein
MLHVGLKKQYWEPLYIFLKNNSILVRGCKGYRISQSCFANSLNFSRIPITIRWLWHWWVRLTVTTTRVSGNLLLPLELRACRRQHYSPKWAFFRLCPFTILFRPCLMCALWPPSERLLLHLYAWICGPWLRATDWRVSHQPLQESG